MNFENVLVSTEGHICYITVNRPHKLNALNRLTIRELSQAMKDASSSPEVRVIILTGAGEKSFVAGADISEFADFSDQEGQNLSETGHQILFNLIAEMQTPVIAAINGFALGGGLELALSCHIRVASDNAKLGLPEVSLGLIPGYGGTQRLTLLVGSGNAMELITTAGMIDAHEAHRIGLVNHVCTQTELKSKCAEIAMRIVRNSPTAVSAAMRAVSSVYTVDVDGFQVEIEAFGSCFGTDDFKEGTTSFLQKRKPRFTGE